VCGAGYLDAKLTFKTNNGTALQCDGSHCHFQVEALPGCMMAHFLAPALPTAVGSLLTNGCKLL